MSENSLANLNSFFKINYADKLADLIPESTPLLKRLPFLKGSEMIGQTYLQPVILRQEQGFSYSNNPTSSFALNTAVAGTIEDAKIEGVGLVLRSVVGTMAITRSQNTDAAYDRVLKYLVANMARSFARRLECMFMYGQSGLGSINAVVDADPVFTLTIEEKEWAAGFWGGSEGAELQIFDGTIIQASIFSVTSVDFDLKKVVVTRTSGAYDPIATNVLYFKGSYGQECKGIDAIITNTGVYANISAANYSLWKGNVVTVPAATKLSFSVLKSGIVKSVAKGLMDEDTVAFVSNVGWSDLLDEQTALRSFDSSYDPKQGVMGTSELVFHTQAGKMTVVPSNFVKDGDAFIVPMAGLMRVGSTDVSFNHPGTPDRFFRELADNMGYELRAMSDQAIFCHAPGKMCKITNLDV